MLKKLSITAAALVAFASTSAHAFMIEPYLGYHLGTYKDNSGAGSGSSESYNGFGFGARAGMTFTDMLFAGLDFHYAPVTFAFDSGDIDQTYLALGAVVGVNISSFRLWGGLNFINEFTDDTDAKAKGMGFKFGVGYNVIPMLSINAEYLINPINEACNAAGDCVDVTNDVSANSIFLSVSAPLSF